MVAGGLAVASGVTKISKSQKSSLYISGFKNDPNLASFILIFEFNVGQEGLFNK